MLYKICLNLQEVSSIIVQLPRPLVLGVAALHMLFSIITLGLWQIIVAFLYNRQYMTRMFMTGWVLADSEGNNEMAAQRLGVVLPKRGRK